MLRSIPSSTRLRTLAAMAIAISAATWTSEIAGIVYVCPYCRVQRTIIGLLGLLCLLALLRRIAWPVRYVAAVLAAFGFAVGSDQHFAGWKKIMSGKFTWGEQWYVNSWLLSGVALFIIMGLLLSIWSAPAGRSDAPMVAGRDGTGKPE